jgi:hypothetical protein
MRQTDLKVTTNFHVDLMCPMSMHYIIQKTLNTNKCTKSFFSPIITHSYMFPACWVIFREKPSVVVTLCCTIQFSENVLFKNLMCSMSVHYIIQKTLHTNKCTKSFFSSIITHSYMFQMCTFSLNCIAQHSVTTTEGFSLKMTQQGGNM